ncbi:MAG TPA: hypothetical protein PLT92_13770 [Ignavibacteriaceae bacterium]|nr:hypothetical protein [Ignavibacteriaceae bacterium]
MGRTVVPGHQVADDSIKNADIASDAGISLSKLASIANSRILGRKSSGSGVIEELTVDEVLAFLSDNTSNDVSTSKHGLVPKAPNDTTKFLRGDGTWDVPAGGSLPSHFVRTSNFSVGSSSSWSNVTGMAFSAAANKKYLCHLFVLGYGASNGAVSTRINSPSGSLIAGVCYSVEDATYYYGSPPFLNTFARISNNAIAIGTGTANMKISASAMFTVETGGSSGDIRLQASNSAGTGQAYVNTGTFLIVQEIN